MARRRFEGIVAANQMEHTLVVVVESVKVHPIYGKRVVRHTRFHVHAPEASTYRIGSHVRFEECRPLSKTKRWRVIPTGEVSKISKVSEISPRP